MRTSKLLVSTNGNTPQRFTNTLRANGTALSSGVSYRISAPAGYTGPITVGADGAVRFGKAAYDKVTADGPQTVTIEAAYKGKMASYAFTLTDHFSPREGHTSVVLNNAIYVIGGIDTAGGYRNDVWKSADNGANWMTVATNQQALGRASHASAVLNDALYVIGGSKGSTLQNDIWKSADGGVTWRNVHANP